MQITCCLTEVTGQYRGTVHKSSKWLTVKMTSVKWPVKISAWFTCIVVKYYIKYTMILSSFHIQIVFVLVESLPT